MNVHSNSSHEAQSLKRDNFWSRLFDFTFVPLKVFVTPFLFLIGRRVPLSKTEEDGPVMFPALCWIPGTPILGEFRILPLLVTIIGFVAIWLTNEALAVNLIFCLLGWLSFGATCFFAMLFVGIISFALG